MCKEMKPKVLLCAVLVTPSQAQDHRNRYEMVEVNGAYRHGRYANDRLKIIKSKVKTFASQDCRSASMMNTTDYVHSCFA